MVACSPDGILKTIDEEPDEEGPFRAFAERLMLKESVANPGELRVYIRLCTVLGQVRRSV